MLYSRFELAYSFFGDIFYIFISNLIVHLPRIINMQICTATSKSTRYVNLEPYTTFLVYILDKVYLVFELAIFIFSWWQTESSIFIDFLIKN